MVERNVRRDYHSYLGCKVCTFKGQDVYLSILDITRESELNNNEIYIIQQEFAEYVFTKIFNVLNFRYGNNEECGSDSPRKEVLYL